MRRHASGWCRICPVAGLDPGLAVGTIAVLAGTIGLADPGRDTIADLAGLEKDTIAVPDPEMGNAAVLVLAGTTAGLADLADLADPAGSETESTSAAMNRQQHASEAHRRVAWQSTERYSI